MNASLKHAMAYAVYSIAVVAMVSSAMYARSAILWGAPASSGALLGKVANYRLIKHDYNVVYIGDSRTYCAMHPEYIDRILGTSSLNLAYWAHWFPTQLSQFSDIVDMVPHGATLVWSIGEQNFEELEVQHGYPIGLRNAVICQSLGVRIHALLDNLMTYWPPLHLVARAGSIRARILEKAEIAIFSTQSMPSLSNVAGQMARSGFGDPASIARTEVQESDGRPVALSQYMKGGGYLLEELAPDHFRKRQHDLALQASPPGGGQSDLAYIGASRWNLFIYILDECRRSGVRLVVNVLEEAPFRYPDPEYKQAVRAFMDGPVRREVEARGFAFIRADLDQLTDADYFDYNHLNSRGAETYSQLLAAVLRPHLPPSARP